MAKILVVDDEEVIRQTLTDILEYESYEVITANDGEQALETIKSTDLDLVLCDIKMPGMDGISVLEASQELKPDLNFVLISGHGTIETAVEAVKMGAFDFISKPPDLNRLLITVRNGIEKANLVTETKVLKRKVAKSTAQIVGDSPAIESIKQTIEKVAPTEARVMITGENGTGKELVARWLHEKSNRAAQPMIEVNCAAIPPELIESELFGHEKGSFTSAHKQRIGKFEQANGGTLFLDEIGDMSLSAQAKVLRALQENKITRVGGDKSISVDVRVIAATNKDLYKAIEDGSFREDLYHRISVIVVDVPPLRHRATDIPDLASSFAKAICKDYGIPERSFTSDAIHALQQMSWTGNIRELRNVVERLIILGNQEITAKDVADFVSPRGSKDTHSEGSGWNVQSFEQFQDFKNHAEKLFIEAKLKANNWNVTKTAEKIGIQRSHLYTKMEKYGISRNEG